MTSNDIITIIDTLCEKLGLAADSFSELVPSLARLQIRLAYAKITVCAAILVVLAIISLAAIPRTMRSIKDCSLCASEELGDHTLTCCLIVADVIGGIAATAVSVCEAFSIICWTAAPEVQAIVYIMELIGGEGA